MVKYHRLARRFLSPLRFLMRPLLNGGTLARRSRIVRPMSTHLSRAYWHTRIPRMLAGVGILGIAACGANGSVGPTTPSPTPAAGDQLVALTVSCQAALLIGERAPCIAVASYGSGRQPLVSFE